MSKKVFRIPFKGYITRAYTIGDISERTPLIILHGGPGSCDERYEPLEKLAEYGIPLIFYDQLGGGYSKVPKDAKICWNCNLFVDELINLINYFKLDKFNILGHSWGGMLALEYACNYSHQKLDKLILFSTLPSTRIWNEEHLKMISDFPDAERIAILNQFQGKKYNKKANKNGIKLFYKKYLGKRSKDLYSFKCKRFPKTNKEIYETMWGKSELFGTGNLRDWDVEDKLKFIDNETLILFGAFDESTFSMNQLMKTEIKNSKWVLLKKSHHIGYVEETDLVIKTIVDFIQ